jgi:hypothetical protein
MGAGTLPALWNHDPLEIPLLCAMIADVKVAEGNIFESVLQSTGWFRGND